MSGTKDVYLQETNIAHHLRVILDTYLEHRRAGGAPTNADTPCQSFLDLEEIFESCDSVVNRQPNLRVTWSVGIGNWAWIPWLAFLDKRVTSTATQGVYVALLFREDMGGVYLTLLQGVGWSAKGSKHSELRAQLRAQADKWRMQLAQGGFDYREYDAPMDLGATGRLGMAYEVAAILSRYYDADSLPSEAEFMRDLEAVLGAYDLIVPSATEGEPTTRQISNVGSYLDSFYISHGFQFTRWQIASFYSALQAKGFVILTGISGTGKTKLAQFFATALPQPGSTEEDENYLFLSVRPDWRDGKSLLGYYNPLTETHEWTPFLRFLLRAIKSYRRKDGLAWFVILDEMNLAHVEYYFADLLSVLESGRDEEGWTREPLRIVAPENASGELPPARLYLPPNLYVIGTVNVDETTHAFSPKVLDRAFTIELMDVDFTNYPPSRKAEPYGGQASDGLRHDLLRRFTRGARFTAPSKTELAEFIHARPGIRLHLQSLNQQLEPFGLHFGYRVFDEIVAFLICAEESQVFDSSAGQNSSFDAAVLMKVLPKFHGSRSKLEQPLIGVLGWCLSPESPQPDEVRDKLAHTHGEVRATSELRNLDYRYPKTAARVIRMLDDLHTTGFAAFG